MMGVLRVEWVGGAGLRIGNHLREPMNQIVPQVVQSGTGETERGVGVGEGDARGFRGLREGVNVTEMLGWGRAVTVGVKGSLQAAGGAGMGVDGSLAAMFRPMVQPRADADEPGEDHAERGVACKELAQSVHRTKGSCPGSTAPHASASMRWPREGHQVDQRRQ